MRIEVEVDTYEQCEAAAAGGADVILLDNMTPEEMARCVKMIAGRALTEASGGITLQNARADRGIGRRHHVVRGADAFGAGAGHFVGRRECLSLTPTPLQILERGA